MRFIVECGEDSRSVSAKDWRDAIRKAWKVGPPKHLGFLIRLSQTKYAFSRPRWAYVSSEAALRIAGYKVKRG